VQRDVSFDVAAGQTVALVGHTGTGKTTIANLIPRFYEVSRGAVRVDGQDVREVTRASLRGSDGRRGVLGHDRCSPWSPGGFRRTRYRGLARTQLAGYLVATAYNLVRMVRLVALPVAA
jgi:ABC-type branched-subunit amino acid transport system ATPase component